MTEMVRVIIPVVKPPLPLRVVVFIITFIGIRRLLLLLRHTWLDDAGLPGVAPSPLPLPMLLPGIAVDQPPGTPRQRVSTTALSTPPGGCPAVDVGAEESLLGIIVEAEDTEGK